MPARTIQLPPIDVVESARVKSSVNETGGTVAVLVPVPLLDAVLDTVETSLLPLAVEVPVPDDVAVRL